MHFRHRQTDGLASWRKREMYILHLALIKDKRLSRSKSTKVNDLPGVATLVSAIQGVS